MPLDLNCDLGEGFGPWRLGDDLALMEQVSSVNVACGFHAGDPGLMRATVEAAVARELAIGAHPSLPDLQGFGRREMRLSPQEVYEVVLYQIGALAAFCRAAGARLHHVKPHGALYNMAAGDPALAAAIAQAVKDFDPELVLYGLAGSAHIEAGRQAGLAVASEVFADRSYGPDGSLTPRSQPGALLPTTSDSVAQVLQMVREGTVRAADGRLVHIEAETLCIHGDGPHAVDTARALRAALRQEGVDVRAPAGPGVKPGGAVATSGLAPGR